MTVYYRLPDGGRTSARIPPPKSLRISTPKPKPLPIFRQPDGGKYPGGQYPKIKAPAPKKVSTTYSAPKLKTASYKPVSLPNFSGGISLPGQGGSAIASIYRRTESQLRQMAKEAVMLEAQPQINALNLAGQQEHHNYDSMIASLRKQLGLSKGDLKTLYDTLDANLAFNAKEQGQINADTKTKMGSVYDQLTSALGSNYQNAQNATSSELSRLGIVDPQANDRLTKDEAFLKGQATTAKSNSSALLDAINASTQGMMSGLRAGNAATGAMLQTGIQQQFDKESADALQKHLAKLAEIRMQQSTLKSSLPGKINQTYGALLDQQYQREMDAAQKLFDNQIKLGNFQLSQQNAQSTAAYHQNQLALEAARIANAKAKPASKPALKGMDKSLAYLQSVAKTSKIPYSQLEALLLDAINGDPKNNRLPGYNKNYISEYSSDIQNAVRSRGYPQMYSDMIRAMNYWFGG